MKDDKKESRGRGRWASTRRRGRKIGEPQPQAWTKKARDDIYARRQAGEHWETIYPDYPDRTRAAMQQQYSAMKKNLRDARFALSSEEASDTESASESEAENVLDIDTEELNAQDSHMADEDLPEVSTKATPPCSNLPAPQASHPNGRPVRNGPLKRKAECMEPELSSSAKRGEHSTRQSEAYSFNGSEPSVGLKMLGDGVPFEDGLLFLPEDLAKGHENFNNLSTAYKTQKASQKEAFETAFKRATRRANEAEERSQEITRRYADQAKSDAEVNAQKLRKEIENIKSQHSNEGLKAALKNLTSAHASAVTKCELVRTRQQSLSDWVATFIGGLEDMTMKEIKAAAIWIEKDLRSLLADSGQAGMELEAAGTVVEKFQKVFSDETNAGQPQAKEAEPEAMEEDKD